MQSVHNTCKYGVWLREIAKDGDLANLQNILEKNIMQCNNHA